MAFHGHECGGLTIGYKAALYAIRLLELTPGDEEKYSCISDDEQVVCIAENDACGIDAIGDSWLQRGQRQSAVSYAWETGFLLL